MSEKNASDAASKLRDEKLPQFIYKRNCKRFEIDWSGFDGLSLETHESYFKEFVTEFYRMMLRLIDKGSKNVDKSELGILKYELQVLAQPNPNHLKTDTYVQGHLWILKDACDWFVGREEEVDAIKQYIQVWLCLKILCTTPAPHTGFLPAPVCAVRPAR